MPDLPPHIETIITEACWGVPGVGQLTGEEKLREILEAGLKAEAQLDQAVELLRQVQRWLQRGGTSSVAGRIDSFLAEQQPCQRCWGEGKEERAIVDFSSATQTEPCPDCNLSDDHRMIEEEMNDA